MGFRLSVRGRKKLICFTKSQRVKLGLGARSQNDCFISNISNPWSTIQLECDSQRPARHMLNTTPLPSPAPQLTPLFQTFLSVFCNNTIVPGRFNTVLCSNVVCYYLVYTKFTISRQQRWLLLKVSLAHPANVKVLGQSPLCRLMIFWKY